MHKLIACVAVLLGVKSAVAAPTVPAEMERLGRTVVEAPLKDPKSVQYRGAAVYRHHEGKDLAFCGEFNAKNSYGGNLFLSQLAARARHDQSRRDGINFHERIAQRGCITKVIRITSRT